MTDLVLTPQRRTELSALLADEPRLHAEYPRVAEYLDTASRLPGTGDERADATFDLRLVHYLTGGASENPYWDIVEPAVSETARRRVVNGKRVTGSARLAFAQTILQSTYAYAIPSPETAAWIADVCDGGPVTEIGAGRGYWAAQLTRAGLTVHAYDSEPPDITENPAFPATPGQRPLWHPVSADPTAARKAGRHDHTLLLCWPPAGATAWPPQPSPPTPEQAAPTSSTSANPRRQNRRHPFFEALDHHWHLTSEDPRYVSWWNLNDRAQLWTRRR